MLSTNIEQESVIKRVEKVVSILMEENPIFKEDLNYAAIVKHILKIVQENLTPERFNNMSDEKLKENCDFVMSTEVLSKIGEDLTPEQMAIFDEAIKRK
ncbi:hypothetical protein SR1949_00650 [Sphaerospermopsis reniformis]|uniref:Uncharacterized protein n=1 Tax=Sphaerospermopsis reniformis TaxID=531300 RepID=A0A479ZU36_9CYAN|nr:hypothetical protein [Sphaerospermopsis reniformis]GCL34973.1 hypothetical protein SR1949_00650 [Sphaerospermopsis reniformis]